MMNRRFHVVSPPRFTARVLPALAFLLFFTLAAYGQVGSITGTITDPGGASVANLSIEAKNSQTGAVFQGGTSTTGNYVIRVPAGAYELTGQAPGFK